MSGAGWPSNARMAPHQVKWQAPGGLNPDWIQSGYAWRTCNTGDDACIQVRVEEGQWSEEGYHGYLPFWI